MKGNTGRYAYSVPLSKTLRKAGWRAKICDAEGPEEPHISVFRTGQFLDEGDTWSQIDDGVRAAIQAHWATLPSEWNKLHGDHNPISSEEQE